jgi:hypothetical protein
VSKRLSVRLCLHRHLHMSLRLQGSLRRRMLCSNRKNAGANQFVFAYTRVTVQRNIYRIPLN